MARNRSSNYFETRMAVDDTINVIYLAGYAIAGLYYATENNIERATDACEEGHELAVVFGACMAFAGMASALYLTVLATPVVAHGIIASLTVGTNASIGSIQMLAWAVNGALAVTLPILGLNVGAWVARGTCSIAAAVGEVAAPAVEGLMTMVSTLASGVGHCVETSGSALEATASAVGAGVITVGKGAYGVGKGCTNALSKVGLFGTNRSAEPAIVTSRKSTFDSFPVPSAPELPQGMTFNREGFLVPESKNISNQTSLKCEADFPNASAPPAPVNLFVC